MTGESSRLDELRRRVESDPASIAFAQLAEEYRRSGNFEEAVRICRIGLEQHPAYLSARVTLGRALMELQQHDEAQAAFEYVLLSAPDNLIALRGMADIHQRRGQKSDGGHEFGDVGDPVVEAPQRLGHPASQLPGPDPVLEQLETWLAAILDERASRATS